MATLDEGNSAGTTEHWGRGASCSSPDRPGLCAFWPDMREMQTSVCHPRTGWGPFGIAAKPYPRQDSNFGGAFSVLFPWVSVLQEAQLCFLPRVPCGDSQAQLQPAVLSRCFSRTLKHEDWCSQLNECGAVIFQGCHPVLPLTLCSPHTFLKA